jgi:hypothetical protein
MLSQYIPYVIGIDGEIGDIEAISFSRNFYKTLSLKNDIEFSFNFSIKSCNLFNLSTKSKPVLFKQENYIRNEEIIKSGLQGLKEAALTMSELGKPVFDIATTLAPLLLK